MDPGNREDPHSDEQSIYTLISLNSSQETRSDLVGLGRNLGNLYKYLGLKLENLLSVVAVRIGLGPRKTASELRRLVREDYWMKPSRIDELERLGTRLVKYAQ